jgi:hypothetical protein
MESPVIDITLPDNCDRIALCGGPYSNFAAVEAFLSATATVSHRFCLGDIGGFGPDPNRTLDLLRQAGVTCLQGNYDHAVGHGERDCGCGYTDPRDQAFAQISYDYTYAQTAAHHRDWLRTLPPQIRLRWRDRTLLLCHGSPDGVNDFVWESTTGDRWIEDCLERYGVDGICATHTGIPWWRQVRNGFWFNVGVLGRPAHDGSPQVYYGLLQFPPAITAPAGKLVPLTYDVAAVVTAMATAGLPVEFQDSLRQGIWTTCAEILPPAERPVRDRTGPLSQPAPA